LNLKHRFGGDRGGVRRQRNRRPSLCRAPLIVTATHIILPQIQSSIAVAAAISLFGFHSGAELAIVAGVLIEVPAMLLVVRVVNGSKSWYERSPAMTAAKDL
jgi:hypothetical protein